MRGKGWYRYNIDSTCDLDFQPFVRTVTGHQEQSTISLQTPLNYISEVVADKGTLQLVK